MSKKYLFIGSHPDDIEFGCGGTVAKLASEGNEIVFVVVTNGDQGSLTIPQDELAKTRQDEAKKSANLLGVKNIEFLNLRDGLTWFKFEEKLQLISLIRKYKPDTVFTHARSDHHPDHEIVHKMTMDSIKTAAGPWFKEAKGGAHQVSNVFGYEVWNPINQYQMSIDITPFFDKKDAALNKHKSQIQDYPYTEAVKGLAQYRGSMVNGKGLAEVFEVLRVEF